MDWQYGIDIRRKGKLSAVIIKDYSWLKMNLIFQTEIAP